MAAHDRDQALIQQLQQQVQELEEEASQIKQTVNLICRRKGIQAIYADADTSSASPNGRLQSDTFYGQKLNTAIRKCLEIRKASGIGPASVRAIYDMLKEGGYHFTTKSEDNAMRSLRASLNKSSHTFHRLPNGDYGLLEWYPEAKSMRDKDDTDATANNGTTEPEGESDQDDAESEGEE